MRSGISIHGAGICLVLATAIGTTTASAQSATDRTSSAVPSRRLPHRMTVSPVQTASPRPGNPRNLAAESPRSGRLSAAPSIMAARFLSPATSTAPSEQWVDTAPHTVSDGVPIETLWEDPDGVGPWAGDGSCCDTGPTCCLGLSLDHLSVYAGVQGSKNNSNRGQDGSFGFQEGINIGLPAMNIILPRSVGLQAGLQANQANLDGAGFTDSDRKQYFLTVGAFRRGDYGLQGGLVFDQMWDKWNYDLEVGQVRGEISMALNDRNSYGFWFTSSVTDNVVVSRVSDQTQIETWETVDIYAIFYRTAFLAGGQGEGHLMAGVTQDSDGIIGGKTRLPLSSGWAVESEFMYLIPEEQRGFGANTHESWNLAINMVWYPGSMKCGESFRYHRPLFDVANNGSMILRRTR